MKTTKNDAKLTRHWASHRRQRELLSGILQHHVSRPVQASNAHVAGVSICRRCHTSSTYYTCCLNRTNACIDVSMYRLAGCGRVYTAHYALRENKQRLAEVSFLAVHPNVDRVSLIATHRITAGRMYQLADCYGVVVTAAASVLSFL